MKECENNLCGKEFEGESLYCSDECYLEATTMPEPVTKEYVDILARMVKLNEVEAVKLNLQPGDTLMVTVKHDEVSQESLNQLRKQIASVFPNNKVFVFNVGTDGDIKFAVVNEPKVSYYSDCNCGKKEAAEKS